MLSSLAQLRRAALLGRVASLTLDCWGLVYLSGYFNLLGLGIRVPIWDAIFAYSFPTIASMTPFYMLAGFGVYEGSFGAGLHLVDVPLNSAIASGLVLHRGRAGVRAEPGAGSAAAADAPGSATRAAAKSVILP